MEEQQDAECIDPEQTRMVSQLVRKSGIVQDSVSRNSEAASKAYKLLCPDLPDRLSPPTISRMMRGKGIKKLKRSNLHLLYLTIHYYTQVKPGLSTASPSEVQAATEFADTVLQTGSGSAPPGGAFYNPNDPRHDRAAEILGRHGVDLIELAISQNNTKSFRKLAVLQFLSGNADDARYWNERAARAASAPPGPLNPEVAAEEAFTAGLQHAYNGNQEVAETYLALAAGAAHREAVTRLSEMRQMRQQSEESPL
ncbi:hypothetical protein [Actinomadura gamaensis]|uniref:Uncharacterized protein n=1 Tax=Actinomadura gamaensis TaxID=1763541 RepID=A0ABV9UC10_9ACTN